MKFMAVVVSIILASCPSNRAAGQDNGVASHRDESSENPLSRFGKDLWTQARSPFSLRDGDWLWIGAGVVTTAALMVSDGGTYRTLKDLEIDNKWIGKVSPGITRFGEAYAFGFVGTFAGISYLFDDSRGLETSYLATEAALTAGVWGIAIKFLTGRQRPALSTETGGEWNGPFGYLRRKRFESISSFDSFPSGHTLIAFSIATVFASQYSDNFVIPAICYTTASLVGVSRIVEDAHWASDVFVGAVIGILTAKEVMANNPSRASRSVSGLHQDRLSWSLGTMNDAPVVRLMVHL